MPGQLVLWHRGLPLVEPAEEPAVLGHVVVDVVPGHGLLEKGLFEQEVVVLDVRLLHVGAAVVPIDLEDSVEEAPVPVVHLRQLDGEGLVPTVGLGNGEDGLGCCGAQDNEEKTGDPHNGGGGVGDVSSCDALVTNY